MEHAKSTTTVASGPPDNATKPASPSSAVSDAIQNEAKPESTTPLADDATPTAGTEATSSSAPEIAPPLTLSGIPKRLSALAKKGARSVTFWTIFGIITTFLFAFPSAVPAWLSLFEHSAEDMVQRPARLDPAVAMVCLEFADHPIVRQSGQCAGVSLSDLSALDMEHRSTSSETKKTFEDFAIIREIPLTAIAYTEARKWPAPSIGPYLQWPVVASTHRSYFGTGWLDLVEGHYKEWATQIEQLQIPITHHVLFLEEEEWQFQSAEAFFSSRSIFDFWDHYLFSIASISQEPGCLGCLHVGVPLVSLEHPYNVTLQYKDANNPLLDTESWDCDELYRWGTNQQWRMECFWPEVYQNLQRLSDEGYLDREPPLRRSELSEVVKAKGWEWRTRPYV